MEAETKQQGGGGEDNRSGDVEVTMQLMGWHVRLSFYVIIHGSLITVWKPQYEGQIEVR